MVARDDAFKLRNPRKRTNLIKSVILLLRLLVTVGWNQRNKGVCSPQVGLQNTQSPSG